MGGRDFTALMDPLLLLAIGLVVVVGGVLALRMHAFLALVLGGLIVAALTPAGSVERFALSKKQSPAEAKKLAQTFFGERLAREFGNTCGRVGILIALASIIGKCLMDSGGADRIVRSLMHLFGEPRAPLAFLVGGYVLAIPIFYDTVFLLLIPLGKALWLHTRRNFVLYVCAMIAGGTMTHSLVPPTPGPLFVATELGVDIGLMILMGCLVSAVTGTFGYLYGVWINRRLTVPVRESAHAPLAELEALARRDERELPPLWLALLPILLPVALIGGRAVAGSMGWMQDTMWRAVLDTLGDANLALAFACAIALAMLAWQKRAGVRQLAGGVQGALAEAGLIILITAAGGAFGGVLQQTGIGARIEELSGGAQGAILPLAWAVTALIRAAQGSATVAMITTVGMFGGLAAAGQLGFHPVYLALAIGCGSKPLPWMNDSGFWVIGKMSGLSERETLQTLTAQLTIMGVVGLGVVMLLAKVAPLV
jgi:GntP family gluconate:H+ symporter